MRWLVPFLLPAAALAGDPVFVDRSAGLPGAHEYTGGWEHFVGGGVAVFDCDADGLPEIAAAGGSAPARLFRNVTEPGGDLAFAPGAFPEITGVTGLYPLDIDSDGRQDLFVLRVGPNMALKGGPDCRFAEATEAWGIEPGDAWSTAFSATWEPGQTWPTLAVGNYVDRADPEGPFGACAPNALYRPAGDGYGPPVPLQPGFCALSMLFTDWARRGRADLRVSNDRHYYVRGGSEQMWRMNHLRLLGPEDGWERISIWGMGIASEDLNGDGYPEVMLTSMGDQLLQFGNGSGYQTAPYALGATAHRPHVGDDGRPSTGWHAAFGDVDNDGRPDLFIAKGNVDQMPENAMHDPNNLLMQRPDGTFEEAAAAAGIATMHRARGAALADLNADGRLDLVVVNRRAPMELWQNATADAGHWLAVKPSQTGANPDAVGAWIELALPDGRRLSREITVGGGHASGVAAPAHFGLGAQRTARLRVIWPGGGASDWQAVTADRLVEIPRSELAQ